MRLNVKCQVYDIREDCLTLPNKKKKIERPKFFDREIRFID